MTFDAVFSQDRGDVVGIGDRRFRFRKIGSRDDAAVHRRLGDGNFLVGEYGVEGVFQIVLRRFGTTPTDAILVVNPSSITYLSSTIEDDDFGDALFTLGVSLAASMSTRTQLKFEVLDTYKNKPPVPTVQANDVAVLMSIVYKR